MSLTIPPASDCCFDAVALGEVMLRLDPGEDRVRTARLFHVREGGGEYNVVRALSTVFELRTSILTGIVDNDVGALLLSLIRTSGVDTSYVHRRPFDGIGREARNGLNFTERGYGLRGARGTADRGHTAASQLHPDDLYLHRLLDAGTRWFHTGGVFAGLAPSSVETAVTCMRAARHSGAVVSVDLNYRPSLWSDPGRARSVFGRLVAEADVVIGGETDFVDRLGAPPQADADPARRFECHARHLLDRYPNASIIATTTRVVHSASRNTWSAMAASREGVERSPEFTRIDILDRVGGGDAFAAGLIGSLLAGETLSRAVTMGAAHGALAMTTPGDGSAATLAEVRAVADGTHLGETSR